MLEREQGDGDEHGDEACEVLRLEERLETPADGSMRRSSKTARLRINSAAGGR